jgi:hypothetical protein
MSKIVIVKLKSFKLEMKSRVLQMISKEGSFLLDSAFILFSKYSRYMHEIPSRNC